MAPRKTAKIQGNIDLPLGGDAVVVGTHVIPTVDTPLQQGQVAEDFQVVTLPGVGFLDLWEDGTRKYHYRRGVALRLTYEDIARIQPHL